VEGDYRVGRGENALFLKIKKGTLELLVGVIYGPNENDVDFYREISQFLERENMPFVLGGDFNTILDQRRGAENLDREGEGMVPNLLNSNVINEKIGNNFWLDPFRLLYPETKEFSYMSFRGDNVITKNRLDFFLVSQDITGIIKDVEYKKLGNVFDHKEVTISLGREKKGRKDAIFNGTLGKDYAENMGFLGCFEILNEHRVIPCNNIRQNRNLVKWILE
jgi:hypothetical protein